MRIGREARERVERRRRCRRNGKRARRKRGEGGIVCAVRSRSHRKSRTHRRRQDLTGSCTPLDCAESINRVRYRLVNERNPRKPKQLHWVIPHPMNVSPTIFSQRQQQSASNAHRKQAPPSIHCHDIGQEWIRDAHCC